MKTLIIHTHNTAVTDAVAPTSTIRGKLSFEPKIYKLHYKMVLGEILLSSSEGIETVIEEVFPGPTLL